MLPSDTIQSNLTRLKKCVEYSQSDFQENRDRFSRYKRLITLESCSEEDKTVLQTLNREPLEFNVLEFSFMKAVDESD